MGQFLGDLCADVCPVPSQNVVFRDANGDQSLKGSLVRCICCRIQSKSCALRPADEQNALLCSLLNPTRHLVEVRSNLLRAQHNRPGEALKIAARIEAIRVVTGLREFLCDRNRKSSATAVAGRKQDPAMLPGTFCGLEVNLLPVLADCYLIFARLWALGANGCPERQDDGADG